MSLESLSSAGRINFLNASMRWGPPKKSTLKELFCFGAIAVLRCLRGSVDIGG